MRVIKILALGSLIVIASCKGKNKHCGSGKINYADMHNFHTPYGNPGGKEFGNDKEFADGYTRMQRSGKGGRSLAYPTSAKSGSDLAAALEWPKGRRGQARARNRFQAEASLIPGAQVIGDFESKTDSDLEIPPEDLPSVKLNTDCIPADLACVIDSSDCAIRGPVPKHLYQDLPQGLPCAGSSVLLPCTLPPNDVVLPKSSSGNRSKSGRPRGGRRLFGFFGESQADEGMVSQEHEIEACRALEASREEAKSSRGKPRKRVIRAGVEDLDA